MKFDLENFWAEKRKKKPIPIVDKWDKVSIIVMILTI